MKTIKYTIIISFSFLFFTTHLNAQQLAHFTAYRDYWSVLNPAAMSNNLIINEMNVSVAASYRQQWVALAENSPKTQVLNFELNPGYGNVITGGHIINDSEGEIDHTGIYGQFAYRIKWGRRIDQALVIGLSGGIQMYRANLYKINQSAQEPESLAEAGNDNAYSPDFSLGLFYHYDDDFYAGFSIPQTFGINPSFRSASGIISYDRQQHYYLIVGGYIPVSWIGNSDDSFIEPSMWVRYTSNAPISVDGNIRYQISEIFWAGAGGTVGFGDQFSTTINIEAGSVISEAVDLDGQLKIGFGFEIPLGIYRKGFGAGMEINAVYSWGN